VRKKLFPGVWTHHPLLPLSTQTKLLLSRHALVVLRGGLYSTMARKGDQMMEVLYTRCAGLDGHQRFVVACLRVIEDGQRRKETRTFRCVTPDRLALRRWLVGEGCTQVVLESTGVYAQLVNRLHKILEEGGIKLASVLSDVLGV
jgi:hypothetical protein